MGGAGRHADFRVLGADGGEVRWAEWTEIDRENGVWTVPAKRMKSNREHRVPLCGRAVEILDEARRLVEGTSPFLFPNRVGKQLEEKQLRRMFRKHGIAAVPHGFRSSFRDWAAEKTDHPREVIEAALAHVVQNRVEAAYRRTDLFERRRRLMGDWAAYLAGAPREPEATTIVLLGETPIRVDVTDTFWTTCPEFRSSMIGSWVGSGWAMNPRATRPRHEAFGNRGVPDPRRLIPLFSVVRPWVAGFRIDG